MTKTIFKVPGISCQHCVHTITRELGTLSGIRKVGIDLDTKSVSVEYDETMTSAEVESFLTEINYPVEKN